ncbi:MAG: protoporphyrinogen oxidase [Mariniphaga sp.]
MKDVVILGAGITGLTTAHHLKKKGINFCILEKSDRVGGVINSVNENGFTYEEGPNSGVIGNVEVLRLFEELKDACVLEEANENVKKRYILKNGKWEALPSGLMNAIKTPLFTLKDKFKILGEPFRRAGKIPNESLAGLVKRRLGQSFLDYAIDPFILGVYAGDPDRLITRFALPKLYNLEQQYGSFIGGSIKKKFEPKTEEEKQVTRGVFSVKGGLISLINALKNRIEDENIHLELSNVSVRPEDKHFIVSYFTKDGVLTELETKKIISTIGAYQLDKVLPFVRPEVISQITNLYYAPVIEVILGFNRWRGMKVDAFGGLIPFKENRGILGVLFMSALFKERAPKDGALFSIFMGGVRKPEICDLPINQIKEIIKQDICQVMKADDFEPDLFKIIHHKWAIPQYEADTEYRLKAVEMLQTAYPGLIIGGNLRNGIGMADRILQAKMLANDAL